MIILLYGQPASGKTTLANKIYEELWSDSFGGAIKLDGDKWREITKNKDYSKEGRMRNLKSAFDCALYLEKDGYVVILSFVTPYKELRDYLKENAESLVQIYLEYNEDRGRNQNFASDFELPENDILKINTSENDVEKCLDIILDYFFEKVKLKNIENELD